MSVDSFDEWELASLLVHSLNILPSFSIATEHIGVAVSMSSIVAIFLIFDLCFL
jgi:hypothetical protein